MSVEQVKNAAGSAVNAATSTAGSVFRRVKGVLPAVSVIAAGLALTAVLTGGGSTALAAGGGKAASLIGLQFEGITEAMTHVTNGASWVASHLPAATKAVASVAPTLTP